MFQDVDVSARRELFGFTLPSQTLTHSHSQLFCIWTAKIAATNGALVTAPGMLHLQVTARSLTVNGTRKMAKVTAGGSGRLGLVLPWNLMWQEGHPPGRIAILGRADGRTLKVSLQRLGDRACKIVGEGKKKEKKKKPCTAAARYRLRVALLRLTALCWGIKADQHLEGKIKIGQTAREERLALARGSDNERASPVPLPPLPPSACLI